MDKLKALNTYIETTKREILEGKHMHLPDTWA